jgi:hypothetical protein
MSINIKTDDQIDLDTEKREFETVLKSNPKLGYFGWEYPNHPPVEWDIDCAIHEFIRCKELYNYILSHMTKLSIKRCSYGLKHQAERDWNYCECGKYYGYVSNGSAIAAAIAMGIEIKRESLFSPNSTIVFKISHDQRKKNKARQS